MLAAIISAVGVAMTASTLSLGKSFLHFFNREDIVPSAVLGAASLLLPLSGLIGVAITIPLVSQIKESWSILTLAAVFLLVQQAQEAVGGALRAARDLQTINIARIVQQLWRVGAIGLLAAMDNLSLHLALGMEVVALTVAAVVLLRGFVGRPDLRPKLDRPIAIARRMISYGVLYQAASIVWILHLKLDVLLLHHYKGDVSTGLYVTAVNLGELVGRLPAMLLLVLSPHIAGMRDERASLAYASQMCRTALPILLFVAGGMWFIAPWLVVLMFGTPFVGAASPLRVLLPGIVCSSLYVMIVSFLVVKGYLWPLLVIQLIGFCVNISLNLLLIPRLDATGAAWSSVVSYSSVFVMSLLYLRWRHGLKLAEVLLPTKSDICGLISRVSSRTRKEPRSAESKVLAE